MKNGFLSDSALVSSTWQYLERAVGRLLTYEGYSGVRMIGQTGDQGADILAYRNGKRWLVQIKYRKGVNIGVKTLDETVKASYIYRAQIPVIATNQEFSRTVTDHQSKLIASGIQLQLWGRSEIIRRWDRLSDDLVVMPKAWKYQEEPIKRIEDVINAGEVNAALIVMATGLGKTFVTASAIKKVLKSRKRRPRILFLAHTNPIVYQLERALWPFIDKYTTTTIWNGYELPNHNADITFACIDSVYNQVKNTGKFPVDYDIVVIDECHHAGSPSYTDLIQTTSCGKQGGAFLLGLTATPWRADGNTIREMFGDPIVNIDIVEGLKKGWLSNVDYRLYTSNIDWKSLNKIQNLTPRGLNKTIFITEWNDSVVTKLKDTWYEMPKPRAIVFCGTIEHALIMRDRINALGFARAAAIYSGGSGAANISHADRNRILCDFHDGHIDVLCTVDILNEGIDVPDINIVVFQRVTHSRRIFVQQLGRGLRIAEGKDKVIVLDFVSDIRRIAEGIDLKNKLGSPPQYIEIGSKVRFMNSQGEDKRTEAFLREWIQDVAAIAEAGEDDHVLKFPPSLEDLNYE